ncbi:hypothetical protein HQ535_13525 [bacterium]|nr:hypothetical protein [bacterium]
MSPATTAALPETSTPTAPYLPSGDLPPADLAGIAAAFDPFLESIGYRVTRGALIDRSTYAVDPTGTHLAVYVAPIDDIDLDRYAADLIPVVRTFLPVVFDQWKGLESFDVCQEPRNWDGPGDPPSLSLLDVFRTGTGGVPWQELDVAGLADLAAESAAVTLWVTGDVRETETWQALFNPGP